MSTATQLAAKILKVDDERRQITGWANIMTNSDGSRVIDFQGDMIPVDEVEKAAAELITEGGKNLGVMHEQMGAGRIVESMVVTTEKRKALGFGEGPEGWAITAKVDDDAAWAQVKAGKLTELSIGGEAERVDA